MSGNRTAKVTAIILSAITITALVGLAILGLVLALGGGGLLLLGWLVRRAKDPLAP